MNNENNRKPSINLPDSGELKDLEKRVYRSIFQDGFWDILIGLLLLGMTQSWSRFLGNDIEYFYIVLVAILWNSGTVLIFSLGKKFISTPRLGYVEFSTQRKKKRRNLQIYLIVNVFMALFLVILLSINSLEVFRNAGSFFSLFIGYIGFGIPFLIIAYFLDFKRLYGYAIYIGFSFYLNELFISLVGTPFNSFLSLDIPGITIVAIGLIFLVRFIKTHPKLAESKQK